MKRSPILWVLFAIGCTRPESPSHATPLASATSTTIANDAAIPTASAAAEAPTIDVAPISTTASGPAYVLVDHSGVLQITESGATTVFPVPKDKSSLFTEIGVSSIGSLWMSDFQGVRVRSLQGEVSNPRVVKDGPLYEKLVIRSNKDIWGVSSDIEWNVVHFDGTSWKNIRHRGQFPGRYEDNKFSSLAVTSEGAWVASWNGLWRGKGDQWEKIDLPEIIGVGADLLVYRDQLVIANPRTAYLRKGESWTKLVWPDNVLLRWAISDLGLVTAPRQDKSTVVIGSVENGSRGFVESEVILGHDLRTLTIDGAARIWVGTDQAIAVLDQRGHLLMQWATGTLDGLTGSILDIAVVGAGPAQFPKPKPARTWEIRGKFVTYKGHLPLAQTSIALCASGAFDCAKDSQVKRFTTDASGGFRFSSITDGEFRIEVTPPSGTSECVTPFTKNTHWIHPAEDCHDTPGAAGICDLGTITTCLPFEMPPPH